jgi:hypothetical protein
MEATRSSETSDNFQRAKRHYIPEDMKLPLQEHQILRVLYLKLVGESTDRYHKIGRNSLVAESLTASEEGLSST